MGYEPVDIAFTQNSYRETWKGLGKTLDAFLGNAFIDDAPGRSSWFMAVGAFRKWPSSTGRTIPGPVGTVGFSKVELYVKRN